MLFSTTSKLFLLLLLLWFPLSLSSVEKMPYGSRMSQDAKVSKEISTRFSVDPNYALLEQILGSWQILGSTDTVGHQLTIDEIYYEDFYESFIAIGSDDNGYKIECLVDKGYYTSSKYTYICWDFESDDATNDAYYSFSFVGDELHGAYGFGEFFSTLDRLAAGDAQEISLKKATTQELLQSDLTALKNRLLEQKEYAVSGSFAHYDFAGVDSAFDWTFTTPSNDVYQLQGNPPSSNDVFGWKKVAVQPDEPTWFMSYLGDWDGDGSGKYDWILVGNGFDAVYKLEGVTSSGNFAYSQKIDIPYTVSADKKTVLFATAPTQTGSSDFFTVDENSIDEKHSETIPGISHDAKIEVTPAASSLQLNASDIISTNSNKDEYVTAIPLSNLQPKIGEPLFIDNLFSGVIQSVTATGSNTRLTTKDATYVTDVYDGFDLEFNLDELQSAVTRRVQAGNLGRYDDFNAAPLQLHVIRKYTPQRSRINDELVLRIDIPKGYIVPINPRTLECDFWSADCTFTMEGSVSKDINLSKETTYSALTFSTKGSYIEVGLGNYLQARYDKNTFSADFYSFELRSSAYFDAEFIFSVSGKLEKEWSTSLNLVNGFDVEILHPYSHIAKTTVFFKPDVSIGVSGSISGSITAKSKSKRKGEIRFKYNSSENVLHKKNTVTYTPTALNQDSFDINIEAKGNAYVYPQFITSPRVMFLRVSSPLTFGAVRSGVKLDNTIEGKISKGFVVENDAITQSKEAQVSVVSELYALIEYKMNVLLGAKELYKDDEFKQLYKSPSATILEWKAQLLKTPTIKIEQDADALEYKVSFDIDINATIKKKVRFYYTLDGSDISVDTYETAATLWDRQPLVLNTPATIKVRAVLLNRDISQAIWSFGTSMSDQAEQFSGAIAPPTATPVSNSSFTDTLKVTFTQQQGYDVYYQLNGSAEKKYTAPIEISKSSSFKAFAAVLIDGNLLKSDIINFNYIKCGDSQKLQDNVCVEKTCRDDGFDCPVCTEGEVLVYHDNGVGWCDSGDGDIQDNSGDSQMLTCPMIQDPNEPVTGWDRDYDYEIIFYSSGNLQVSCSYDYDGLLKKEISYNATEKHGIQKEYDCEGMTTLTSIVNYVDGKENGLKITYYCDGSIASSVLYVNGVKEGIETLYYHNGNIEWTYPFSNGVLDGTAIYYSEAGFKIKEEQFKDGSKNLITIFNEKGSIISLVYYYDDGSYKNISYNTDGTSNCSITNADGTSSDC